MKKQRVMAKGEYVWIWFDTGAFGAKQLYGIVTRAGPKTFDVRWESDHTNRLRQDSEVHKAISFDDMDEHAQRRLGKKLP